MAKVIRLHGGKDPREVPFYGLTDAAAILNVPASTLRAWCGLKEYRVVNGKAKMAPLLRRDPATGRITFHTLVEAYVVSSITRVFNIRLPDLRVALKYIGGERPLLDNIFYAADRELYVEAFNKAFMSVHRSAGQYAIRGVVESSVDRIEFDPSKRPERFSPWRRSIDEPRAVSIDPQRAFGRPTVKDRSLQVASIVDLYRAGESVAAIAQSYELDEAMVADVLAWGGCGETRAA